MIKRRRGTKNKQRRNKRSIMTMMKRRRSLRNLTIAKSVTMITPSMKVSLKRRLRS